MSLYVMDFVYNGQNLAMYNRGYLEMLRFQEGFSS